jgi:CelD/BcsL family acetyltransferase involved in cellulose biosynthesis
MINQPLSLIKVNYNEAPALEKYHDHTIFQTEQWLQFVASTQNAEPVIAAVIRENQTVGRFTGLIIRKIGLRILGSPMAGWTTSYMGFNLEPSVSRADALVALEKFAFSDLKCIHFELMDRHFSTGDIEQAGYTHRILHSFEIDLSKSEEELLAAMKPECRRCIRKAEKENVQIEEVKDESFADDYYPQMQDVFAKQGLVPTYSKRRVQTLIKYLLPTGNLLLARARNQEGKCIATGIFPAKNDTMYFWAGASWRSDQNLRPNEAIQWFAMLYWKERGITKYDMGGGGEYKRKYGGEEIAVPWVRKSKYLLIEHLRNFAKAAHTFRQRLFGLRKS